MSDSLIESYRNAKKRHSTGGVTLVCLDDESLEESEYGALGQRTIVPRSNKEGGIYGIAGVNDRKYGQGVRRREVNMDDRGFFVEEEVEGFRPDQVDTPEETDTETEELAAEDPMAVLQDALLGNQFTEPQAVASQPHVTPTPAPDTTSAVMLQMMQMMQGMMNTNGHKKEEESKPKPVHKDAPRPGKKVSFSGDFGRFTAPYSDARAEDGFVLLASGPEQPSTYEPPISSTTPLAVTVDGTTYSVLNVGLSFEYKGDIVTIMPLKAETPDEA
jgi:hypothetical protein